MKKSLFSILILAFITFFYCDQIHISFGNKNNGKSTTMAVSTTMPFDVNEIFTEDGLIKAHVISPNGERKEIKVSAFDIVVKINQVESQQFPIVKLFVSVTDKNGQPLEIDPRAFSIEENNALIPSASIMDITQQKHSEKLSIPVNIVLVIDKSGSMRFDENGNTMGDDRKADWPMTYAKGAAVEFIEEIEIEDQINVLAFDSEIVPLGVNQEAIEKIKMLEPGAHTALYAAMYKSLITLEDKRGVKAVILMTDGNNDTDHKGVPQANHKMTLDRCLEKAKELSLPVFTIGFGKNADKTTLKHISEETDGLFLETTRKEDLANLYKNIRQVINNQYIITYHSETLENPVRVIMSWLQNRGEKTFEVPILELEKYVKEQTEVRQIESKREELAQKEKKLEEDRKELEILKAQLDEEKERIEKRKLELAEQAKAQEEIKKQLEKQETEQKVLQTNLDKQINEQAEKEKLLEDQLAKLKEKQAELTLQSKNLDTKQGELDRWTQRLEDQDKEIKARMAELSQREKDLNSKQAALQEKEAAITKKGKDLDTFEQALNKQNQDLTLKQSEQNQRQAALNQKEAELRTQATQLSVQEKSLKDNEVKIESERQRLDAIRKQLRDIIASIDKSSSEIEKLNP